MPAPPQKQSRYPGRVHRLRDAAELGQLLIIKCNLCRRSQTYLATDLVTLLNPDHDALEPPFTCSKCGTVEFTRVKLTSPSAADYGNLIIRRPGPVRTTQTWRTVKLGD